MKERLKAKMDEYIEKILAKKEITKDEYEIISREYSKIVSEEEMPERIKSMCSAFSRL